MFGTLMASIAENSTLRERITEAPGIRAKDGILTLYDAPFQETCAQSGAEDASLNYNSDGQ